MATKNELIKTTAALEEARSRIKWFERNEQYVLGGMYRHMNTAFEERCKFEYNKTKDPSEKPTSDLRFLLGVMFHFAKTMDSLLLVRAKHNLVPADRTPPGLLKEARATRSQIEEIEWEEKA